MRERRRRFSKMREKANQSMRIAQAAIAKPLRCERRGERDSGGWMERQQTEYRGWWDKGSGEKR